MMKKSAWRPALEICQTAAVHGLGLGLLRKIGNFTYKMFLEQGETAMDGSFRR